MSSGDEWLYEGMHAQTWQPWAAFACALLACAGAVYLWRHMLRGMTDRVLLRRLWMGLAVVLLLGFAVPWLRFAWLANRGRVEETRLVSGELRKPRGYRHRYPSCMALVETERQERWSVALRPEACSGVARAHTRLVPFVVADRLRWVRQPGRHLLLPIGWLVLYAISAGTLWLIALRVRWPQRRWRGPRPWRKPRSDSELVELARQVWSAHMDEARFDARLPEHERFVERTLFAARPGDDYDVALFRVADGRGSPALDTREFWVARKNDHGPLQPSLVAGPFRL